MPTTVSFRAIRSTLGTAIATSVVIFAMATIAVAQTADAPPKPADSPKSDPAPPTPAAAAKTHLPPNPFTHKVPAPALDGAVGWINTAGPLDLRQLRGKFVMLDFWTYCCINCMHILPELKKLEHAYPNELVVIGVHSAKFENEQDSKNITEAVLRYEIEHPVANDAQHAIWNRYGVSSWPTMLLIDPEGNVVYAKTGEFTFNDVEPVLKKGIAYYKAKGTLDDKPIRFDLESEKQQATPLRFPGKVLADAASKRLFVADSNHNRIVVAGLDGKLIEVIGNGRIGRTDGDYATATFNHPQGMALVGEMLFICDTENHLLRRADLKRKVVTTVAGTGVQGRNAWPGTSTIGLQLGNLPQRFVGKPKTTAINSPWDLWVHNGILFIAMAGPHQIWFMPLNESEIGPYAGNGREDIVDGDLLPRIPYAEGFSSFAQPSGLSSDGQRLFVADSEGSSIRALPLDGQGRVGTIVGTSHLEYGRLFTFGDKDGTGDDVRLQHALGVAWVDGVIYIADTYNNKIKSLVMNGPTVATIAGDGKPGRGDSPAQFDEPAGLSYADGNLYVADTNNHLIRTVDLKNGNAVATVTIAGLEPPAKPAPAPNLSSVDAKPVRLERQTVKPRDGAIHLTVNVKLPEGYKINELAPTSYRVEAASKQPGPVARDTLGKSVRLEKPAAQFDVALPVSAAEGSDELSVLLNYYYCQSGNEGLCKMGSVLWTVPLTLSADGAEAATLEIAAE